jgi:hypothetical protein
MFSPETMQELFNLRHASARNVIERSFGVVKKRFTVLEHGSEMRIETQSLIVLSCCVIHNICRFVGEFEATGVFPTLQDIRDNNVEGWNLATDDRGERGDLADDVVWRGKKGQLLAPNCKHELENHMRRHTQLAQTMWRDETDRRRPLH